MTINLAINSIVWSHIARPGALILKATMPLREKQGLAMRDYLKYLSCRFSLWELHVFVGDSCGSTDDIHDAAHKQQYNYVSLNPQLIIQNFLWTYIHTYIHTSTLQ